jgi:drug/metabolite transporter (DMT)-like permease
LKFLRNPATPAIAIAGSAGIWGLWWIPVRALDERGLTGDWASLALYGAAAAAMLPVLAWRLKGGHRPDRVAVVSGLLFGAMMVAWNHALIHGEVVRVTLLFYLAPIWGTLFGFLILGDKPTPRRIAGIVLGIGGAAVILGAGWEQLPLPRDRSDWLSLFAGVSFAASATIMRKAGGTGEAERTFMTYLLATLLALAAAMFAPGGAAPQPGWTGNALPLAAAVSVFMLLPVTWLLVWGSGRLDPGRVAILLLFEVLAAAVSAAILTDEPFGAPTFIGGALILTAAALEGMDGKGEAAG